MLLSDHDDKPKEACGVFGIYNHPEAAKITYLGLYALQHRGQESAGISSANGSAMMTYKQMGLVADVFNEAILEKLTGHLAMGHVRYSTTGDSVLRNAQPIHVEYGRGSLAVAHNGNLVNASVIKDELEAYGSIFQSSCDSEVVVHLIVRSGKISFVDTVVDALKKVRGAYSLLVMNEKELLAVRDPYGFRPLCLGKLGEAYVVASESCAFDIIDATYIRDIEPGEVILINKQGLRSIKPFGENRPSPCVFEFIYFARPDSMIYDNAVHAIRKQMGQVLAREHPVEADIVVPVPDSSNTAALGYAQESKIPFELALIRSHYVGRTFIEPNQAIRDFGAKIKYNPVRSVLKNKRVVVVDDSLVRGTTQRKITKMIRESGAKEIHLRISAPPIMYPCFYGMDFPTRKELIAATHTTEEIAKYLRVDSVGYLSIEGMMTAAASASSHFCKACFDGNYPVKFAGQPLQEELRSKC